MRVLHHVYHIYINTHTQGALTCAVQFISVQDGIYALEKAHIRSTPSLRSFPSLVFETVLSRPFKEDRLALVQFVNKVVGILDKTGAFRPRPKQHTLVIGPVAALFVVGQVETTVVCPALMVAHHVRPYKLHGQGEEHRKFVSRKKARLAFLDGA